MTCCGRIFMGALSRGAGQSFGFGHFVPAQTLPVAGGQRHAGLALLQVVCLSCSG